MRNLVTGVTDNRENPRPLLATLLTAAIVALSIVALVPAPAHAIEQAVVNATVTSTTSAKIFYRGGLSASVTLTQGTNQAGSPGVDLISTTPHSAYGASAGMFSPTLNPASTPTFGLQSYSGMCGDVDYTGFCSGNGTMTITFTQPVTNPVLDISGIGGSYHCYESVPVATSCDQLENNGIAVTDVDGDGTRAAASSISQQLTIATPGVTFANVSAGNSNLAVTPTTLTAANKAGNFRCDNQLPNQSSPPKFALNVPARAGCGSVVLSGTFQSVTFDIGTYITKMPLSMGWDHGFNFSKNGSSPADLSRISIRLQEDLGDAPASYDTPQAATHFHGPLQIGAGITDDQQGTTNPLTNANAGPGANLDTDDGINDGIRADAAVQGVPYSVSVPLAGTTKDGTLAGWIDANGNGLFDVGERVEAAFAAGASSATLTWPASLINTAAIGDTYMRLRASFTASEVASSTGIATSGEVEDYLLEIEAADPSILVVKKINDDDANDVPGVSVAPGSIMNITFDVTNTGNVPLTDVQLSDDVIPGAQIVPPAGWDGTLVPQEKVQFTAVFPAPLTSTTLHTNTATVSGQPPAIGSGGTPRVEDDDVANATTTVSNPAITLVKRVVSVTDVNGDGLTNAGDEILWEFEVKNTGDIILTNVAVTDDMLTNAGSGVTCDPTTLAVDESVICAADAPYVITAADVENGEVVNTATATGDSPDRPVTSEPSTTRTPVEASPSLALDKRVARIDDTNGDGLVDAGDVVWYEFDLENTGDVTLDDLAVIDDMLTQAGVSVSCAVDSLAVGDSTTCKADAGYVITNADVKAGEVVNVAVSDGSTPGGEDVSSNDDTVKTPTNEPSPALAFTGASGGPAAALGFLLLLTGGLILILRSRRVRAEV